MSRVIVFIATSLDGFIALPDDDTSWLDPFNTGDEDYGFAEFMEDIGTTVMGARTYEQSLIHPERFLTGVRTYVLTGRSLTAVPGTDTEFWHAPLADLVRKIQNESKKDVYIVGGGMIISQFLDEGLVDEIRQFIVPVLLHEGIPLYTGLRKRCFMKLVEAVPYQTGIVELHYAMLSAPVNGE